MRVVHDGQRVRPGSAWPGVGVGALVIKDERLLMIQRAGAHGAGKWSVPGGWVELWESPFDTAVREVFEETGVVVTASVLPLDPLVCWTNSPHPDEGVHAITLWVVCYYVSGEPTVVEPAKCPVVEWVPLEKVGNLPLFAPLNAVWTEIRYISEWGAE